MNDNIVENPELRKSIEKLFDLINTCDLLIDDLHVRVSKLESKMRCVEFDIERLEK